MGQVRKAGAMKIACVRVPLLLSLPSWAGAQSVRLDLGAVQLEMSQSETAQIFHIVDQLAEWDQYTHRAYLRWARDSLRLTSNDRKFLQMHRELRQARGWGEGLEQAFLVDGSIEEAASTAVSSGLLSRDEAELERAILSHFAPVVAPLIDRQADLIAEAVRQFQADQGRLRSVMSAFAAFAESSGPTTVPVYLVANPEEESGGGGANGGRLVIEVPSPDPAGMLIHEVMHVLLAPHDEAMRATATVYGIDPVVLIEGITYALGPGITDDPEEADRLSDQLAIFIRRGTSRSDIYAQAYMFAATIRPMLRAAIRSNETITTFLPRAAAAWRSVTDPS